MIQISGKTETGNRRKNDDYLKYEKFFIRKKEVLIAAIADGMGGYLGGEIASKLAVEKFFSDIKTVLMETFSEETLRRKIKQSYSCINQCILTKEKKNLDMKNMGTTLSGLIIIERQFLICSLGDTRVYRVCEEEIHQITEDHSAGAESLREGLINEFEAKKNPYANSLLKYLGAEESYAPDIFPKNGFYYAENGDVILLCTDGISGALEEIDIYEQVIQTSNIEHAVQNLISLSYTRGSKDNMSAILIEVPCLSRKIPILPVYPKIKSSKKTPLMQRKKKRKRRSISLTILFVLIVLEGILVLKFINSGRNKEQWIEKISKLPPGEKNETLMVDKRAIAIKDLENSVSYLKLSANAAITVFIDKKKFYLTPPFIEIAVKPGSHSIIFVSLMQKKEVNLNLELALEERVHFYFDIEKNKVERISKK